MYIYFIYPQIYQHNTARKCYKRKFAFAHGGNKNNNNNKESHKREPCKRSQVYYGQQNEKQFEKYV